MLFLYSLLPRWDLVSVAFSPTCTARGHDPGVGYFHAQDASKIWHSATSTTPCSCKPIRRKIQFSLHRRAHLQAYLTVGSPSPQYTPGTRRHIKVRPSDRSGGRGFLQPFRKCRANYHSLPCRCSRPNHGVTRAQSKTDRPYRSNLARMPSFLRLIRAKPRRLAACKSFSYRSNARLHLRVAMQIPCIRRRSTRDIPVRCPTRLPHLCSNSNLASAIPACILLNCPHSVRPQFSWGRSPKPRIEGTRLPSEYLPAQ